MRFEKLEDRCVMDGTNVGAFCLAFEAPATSASVANSPVDYGPALPPSLPPTSTSSTSSEGESGQQIGDDIELLVPPTRVEYSGPVTEVGQLYTNGYVLIGQQKVPASSGIRAALDILEATGGYVQAWANSGVKAAYHSGGYYYFELETPYEEILTLGERTLLVNVADGSVYTVARF